MVRRRLYYFIFTLLLLLLSTTSYSSVNNSGKLILFTDRSESILGRPVRVELYAVSLKTKISDINLSVLNKDFGVVIDYAINDTVDKRWPNKKVQILKLKLYPRKTGSILIPRIYSNNINSKEKHIIVTERGTSSPRIIAPQSSPYTQQQFIIHIEVLSSDSTSRLSIDNKHKVENFESTVLPFERIKNKEGKYILKTGWALTATISGQHYINLPPIEYSVSGVSRKKFFTPSIPIKIKTLPLYLPPTIPVGKVTLLSSTPKNIFLQSDSIFYWDIQLSGNFNNSYKLPAILRQIKSKSHIQFLPVNSTRSLKINNNSLNSKVNHSIPFKASKSGFLDLPEIKLQYFDPDNGKINTLIYKSEKIIVLSFFWQTVVILIGSLIIFYASRLTYKKWKIFNFSKIKNKQAILKLQENNIREAVKLLTEAEVWPKNITISQWGKYWRKKYQADDNFDDFIKALSSHFYSTSNEYKSVDLSKQLLILIKHKNKL